MKNTYPERLLVDQVAELDNIFGTKLGLHLKKPVHISVKYNFFQLLTVQFADQ